MEWNWKMKNCMIDVTPFLLFESSADSDDAIPSDVHHHVHNQQKQEQEENQEAMDDDAESCSHNLSFHSNDKFHDTRHHKEHEDDDDGHGYGHDDQDDIDDDDDDDDRNWGESKMMGQEKRCHELCADSSNMDPGNQSDVDRKFWETCLGS